MCFFPPSSPADCLLLSLLLRCVGVHSHTGFSALIIRVCEAAYCVHFLREHIPLSAGTSGTAEAAEK